MNGTHYTRRGVVLIVAGPSGAGKTTVYRKLMERVADLAFSVSCTTRSPRDGETDGADYHFLTCDQFQSRVANGLFLEHAEVHGNFYGTLLEEVQSAVAAGRDVLLDIDVQGGRQVRERIAGTSLERCVTFVFIGPPSISVLEQRLRGRGTDSEDVIQRRLRNAVGELDAWAEYDMLVINDDLETAVDELHAILVAARCATSQVQGEVWTHGTE
ncbi:MAG: guanylate kinase [Lentisphaeria bacterium]|nr:guanylate kinase [Lentisphaeria bacterium]